MRGPALGDAGQIGILGEALRFVAALADEVLVHSFQAFCS